MEGPPPPDNSADRARSRYLSKIGLRRQPAVNQSIELPAINQLVEFLEVTGEKQPEKRHLNSLVATLHSSELQRTRNEPRRPDITPKDLEEADEALTAKIGSGYGDYGNACRAQVPEVIRRAVAKGYDIRNQEVISQLSAIVILSTSLGYTTLIGNFQGKWSGGGF